MIFSKGSHNCNAGLVWLSVTTEHKYLCVAIMTIAYFFNGAILSGHNINTLTIAPNRYY